MTYKLQKLRESSKGPKFRKLFSKLKLGTSKFVKKYFGTIPLQVFSLFHGDIV